MFLEVPCFSLYRLKSVFKGAHSASVSLFEELSSWLVGNLKRKKIVMGREGQERRAERRQKGRKEGRG